MTRNCRSVAVLACLALAAAAPAAEPTDVAALFPPGTLAFAEVTDPAQVAPLVAGVVQGSVLQDSIPLVHDRKDKSKDLRDFNGKQELAWLGLLASPEVLAEFKKLRGVGVGLIGFGDRGDPDIALAVLTGESNALGAAFRAFLTLEPTVRKVGAIGNVAVYQFRAPVMKYDEQGRPKVDNDKPPAAGLNEATFAYVPGLVVIGTSVPAVGEVVKRFTGEAKESLAALPAFKAAAEVHRKPGVFFYAPVPELCGKLEAAAKQRGDLVGPDLLSWAKLLANTKAAKTVAGRVAVRDGGLVVTVGCGFAPGQKSPLLDLLSAPGVMVEWLRHAPRPASMAFAVAFPERNRGPAVIAFLDALANSTGELGRLPGEAVRELDEKFKIKVADDLLGKTRGATVVMPMSQQLPKGATALPLVVFHTETPEAAAAWEEFLPKLVGDLSGTNPPPAPSSELVNGVKVLSLPGTGLPWKGAVHSARKGSAIAVGLDRQLVAAAVTGDAAGSVLGGDRPPVVPDAGGAAAIGILSPGAVFRAFADPKPITGPVVPVTGPGTAKPQPGGGAVASPPDALKQDEAKAWAAFLTAIDALPPATVVIRRVGDELVADFHQPKVQGGELTPVINAGVAWFDKLLNLMPDPNNPGGMYLPRGGIRRIKGG